METAPAAFVTGGAQRVGRAIVTRLAAAGYDVGFSFLNSVNDAAALEAALQTPQRKVLAFQVDLQNPAEASHACADFCARHFGRLDILVNNASLYEGGTLSEVSLEQARRTWAVNVESPLLLCQQLAPMLRESKGRIVNMLDLLAERPRPQYVAYCASKAALANLTLSLARELAPDVTVNGIAPGVVEWPRDCPESRRQKYLARVPLKRAGTPADVAELLYFLCTTGSYITGEIIRLDGGRSTT